MESSSEGFLEMFRFYGQGAAGLAHFTPNALVQPTNMGAVSAGSVGQCRV